VLVCFDLFCGGKDRGGGGGRRWGKDDSVKICSGQQSIGI